MVNDINMLFIPSWRGMFTELWRARELNYGTVTLLASLGLFVLCYFMLTRRSGSPIYLVDFACFKAPDELKLTREIFVSRAKKCGYFDEDSVEFQRRVMESAGIGERACAPAALLASPPRPTLNEARREAEMVMFGAVDELFEKCGGLRPEDIGILVVNCCAFNPSPSLADMIVNHYKMGEGILTYNLSGMGCSAGIVSLDLATNVLRSGRLRDSYAMVVSTEILTLNFYTGSNRSMLLPNCLFRVGGAAILLSNRRADRSRAKYQLSHVVSVNTASDDMSYRGNFMDDDEAGNPGVIISRDVKEATSHAMKQNIKTLSPLFLPFSQQILYILYRLLSRRRPDSKPYMPDFRLAFEHLCVHVGVRTVLDEFMQNLRLSDREMEASRMTLHRFGNTSSSAIWYELAYHEIKGRVKRGDRVWQLTYGAGFMSHSAVWKALSTQPQLPQNPNPNPWRDCIEDYPHYPPIDDTSALFLEQALKS